MKAEHHLLSQTLLCLKINRHSIWKLTKINTIKAMITLLWVHEILMEVPTNEIECHVVRSLFLQTQIYI